MKIKNKVLFIFFSFFLLGCGVKAPPLPPLETTAKDSEKEVPKSASVEPSPSPVPPARSGKKR